MQVTSNPWEDLIVLYKEMAMNTNNPSEVSGNNTDPVDGILKELNKNPPDWDLIQSDLEKLQGEMDEMAQVGQGLHPARCPDFGKFLKQTEDILSSLKNDLGNVQKFKEGFENAFLPNLKEIWHDILSGAEKPS